MKLRFGIDAAARERIRAKLDGLCEKPAVGRRLSHVYLDTPDGALAARGIALRFRRSAPIGIAAPRRRWNRQELWPKHLRADGSLKKLGIERLKRRLDATFNVRIERWTWTLDKGWATVSLDTSEITGGASRDDFMELRIVCRKKHAEAATRFAVELGALHVASMRARERGLALLAGET